MSYVSTPSTGDREEEDDDISCVGCGIVVDGSRDYFMLLGGTTDANSNCDHKHCACCFAKAVARKGCSLAMACMGDDCNYASPAWSTHQARVNGVRPTPVSHQAEPPSSRHGIINHPVQYYHSQTSLYKDQFSVLTLTTKNHTNPESSHVIQAAIPTNPAHIDIEIKKDLQEIGTKLHPILIPQPHELGTTSSCFAGSVQSVKDLERSNDSALRYMLHGLGTGETIATTRANADNMQAGRLYQRELNKSYVAADMVETMKGARRGSRLMEFITDQLHISNVGDSAIRLLSFLGISRSKTYMDFSARKAVDQKIRNGLPNGVKGRRYDFLSNHFDNLGARGRPDKTKKNGILARVKRVVSGYVQFTTSYLKFDTWTKLVEWEIYPNPNHPDPANATSKSRVKKDWADEKERYHWQLDVVTGRTMLEESTLPAVNAVLCSLASGDLPGKEGALAWLESNTSVEFDCNITRRVGSRLRKERPHTTNNPDDDIGQTVMGGDEIDDIDELDDLFNYLDDDEDGDNLPSGIESSFDDTQQSQPPRTMFEANNLYTDMPLQEDLNCTKTVVAIAKYTCGIAERMLADEDEEMENVWAHFPEEKRPTPIMQDIGPALCGDGAPIFALLRLTYPQLQDYAFWAVFGGFHSLLELHKKRGLMFGGTHLRRIFGMWRPTTKQQDWVMNPGDPNQVDDESVPLYYAAYAAAAIALVNERKSKGEDTTISATDVVQYTLLLESEKPVARVILQDLRIMETIMLLHLAEEKGDATLFVAALKFCAILLAVTHATKYVFMLAKFFIWWHCGSDAEKTIFEKSLLVQKTVSGKNTFTDRVFEWYQRKLRTYVGKHFTHGFGNRLTQHALMLGEKDLFKRLLDTEQGRCSDSSDPTHTLRMGKVYCETLKWFIEKKIWESDGDKSLAVLGSDDDTIQINPEVLWLADYGEQRMCSYINTYEAGDDIDRGERSDTIVDLSTIQPTLEKRNMQDDSRRKRLVSTTVSEVEKLHNKTEIMQEYAFLQKEFKDLDIQQQFPAKGSKENRKEHYAFAIVSARKILSGHDSEWNQRRLDELNQQLSQRDGNEMEQFEARYSEGSHNIFISLAMNTTEEGRRIASKYNTTKYDLEFLCETATGGEEVEEEEKEEEKQEEQQEQHNQDGACNDDNQFMLSEGLLNSFDSIDYTLLG